nr:arylamine N-acetyltransferase [bacterium]
MPLSVDAYLRRIGYTGPLEPTIEVLNNLQYAHLHTVPYENMDIMDGTPLSLEIPDLYDKIVLRRRGGFCFELNRLYGWLLGQLGFEVHDHFARMLYREDSIPKRRHLVLRVPIGNKQYITDVGIGMRQPRWPLELTEGVEQIRDGEGYRLHRDKALGWVLEQRKTNGVEWENYYSFTEEFQVPQDFAPTSFFCEKHPDSIFNKRPMAGMRCPGGRYSLDGWEFRHFTKDGVTTHTAQTQQEFDRYLKDYFGIVR